MWKGLEGQASMGAEGSSHAILRAASRDGHSRASGGWAGVWLGGYCTALRPAVGTKWGGS